MRSLLYSALSLGLFLAAASAARADRLTLPNGDHISGTLEAYADGNIAFATPFGVLEVAPAALELLETEGPRTVKTAAGAVFTGPLSASADTLTLNTEAGAVAMPWEGVIALAHDVETLVEELASLEAAEAEVMAAAAAEERQKLWSGNVESGLTMRRGNTNTLDFTLSSTLKRDGEDNVLTLKGLAAYGEVEDIINTRRYQGEAKWQVYPGERWYWFVLAGAERDDGRKLELRANTAVGIGRDFIKQEQRALSADIGLDYAWERWAPYTPAEKDRLKDTRRAGALEGLRALAQGISGGGIVPGLDALEQAVGHLTTYRWPLRTDFEREEDYMSLRGSATFRQTLFRESTLTNTLTAFANANDFGEFRVNNELGVATPLTDALKLKLTLRTEYDSLADEKGADNWDNTLVTGLRYEF